MSVPCPPRRSRLTLTLLLLALAIVHVACAATPPAGPRQADVPRYDLPVGRVLSYTSTGETRDADGAADADKDRVTFRATVVSANPDGSRRVVVRQAMTIGDGPADVSVGRFDVYPDGRAVPAGRFAADLTTRELFPLLPPDAAALAAGTWVGPPGWDGSVTTFTAVPPSAADPATRPAGTPAAAAPAPAPAVATAGSAAPAAPDPGDVFGFAAVPQGPMSRAYLVSLKTTVRFDRGRGVVVGDANEMSQGWMTKRAGRGRMTLDADERLDPARAAALGAAYDRYFDAVAAMATALDAIPDEPARAAEHLAAAKAALVAAAATQEVAAEPEVATLLAEELAQHEKRVEVWREDAKKIAAVLRKPTPDWAGTDLAGKRWTRYALKGKVVVVDFWFRGCGWCLHAMPQVKRLAADYAGKPVVVLGMNTDPKEEDARFVADALGLAYPQVRGADLHTKLGIDGFPTLLVIDQAGVVRMVHPGYSPDLRERVGKRIDALLAGSLP